MSSFQAIVAHRAHGSDADMNKRGPALQFVVAITVKEIRRSNGTAGSGRFDGRESSMIIYDIIGKKNFLPASPAHVERRKVIQCAKGTDSSKEPVVFLVPEAMRWRGVGALRLESSRRSFGSGGRRTPRRRLSVRIASNKKNYRHQWDQQL